MSWMNQRVALFLLSGILTTGIALHSANQVSATDSETQPQKSDQKDLSAQLIGTWVLDQARASSSPSGVGTRLKYYTGTHWCIVQPDPVTGVLIFQHGGRYEVDGNKVKATRDFAGKSTEKLIGGNDVLTIEIAGDTMKQLDSKGVYNETWKRLK